jgi:hypothetical protein
MNTHPELGYFDEGLDLIEPKLYAAAQKPFGRAEILPPAAYRSKIFADLEDEKIWTRTWVCIGAGEQITGAGDLLPFTLGNHGIHVQRGKDGGLSGRFNKAQHGGCRAIPLQCQTGMKTKCSFTSCGYSRDQGVIRAAEVGDGSQLAGQYLGDRPERLFPVQIESRGPFLFANVDQDCAALDKQFTGLAKKTAPHFSAGLRLVSERNQEHGCNWKLAGRAFLEDLRPPFAPEATAPGKAAKGAAKSATKGAHAFAERQNALDAAYDERFAALPALPGLAKPALKRASLYWLFPNLLLALMPDHVFAVILQPIATSLTYERTLLFAHESAEGKAAARDAAKLHTLWEEALRDSATAAEERQAEIDGWDTSHRPETRKKSLPKEDSAFGYEFQQFLVTRILTEHKTYWAAPLFSQPGR